MKVEKVVQVTFDEEDRKLLEQMLNAFDKLLQKYEELSTSDRHDLEEKMLNNYDINIFYALDDDLGYLSDLMSIT